MERVIGEVFELDGVKLRVEKEQLRCTGCYFKSLNTCFKYERGYSLYCGDYQRDDKTNVIFTEVKE